MWFSGDKQQRLYDRLKSADTHPWIQSYLQKPLPALSTPGSEWNAVALDFETTGLNPKTDHIISAGWTEIENLQCRMRKNQHHLVQSDLKMQSEQVGIHKITDDLVRGGIRIKDCMQRIFEVLAGKVLLVHYHKIEVGFIQHFCKQHFGHPLPVRVVDTLMLEKKLRDRAHKTIVANELRLFNLRTHYSLPRYQAHNALIDAISTAELLVAQLRSAQWESRTLKDLAIDI